MQACAEFALLTVQMLTIQNSILEMVAKGEPLNATMDLLCRKIESLLPDVCCSVLTVERSGLMHPLASGRLPDAYSALLEGLLIGPLVGSCGSAAYLGAAVSVEDISTDPRWLNYKDPALALGLQACWSSPIFDSGETVIGTFALYFTQKRGPTLQEQQVVRACTSLCAIALERHQRVMERERRAFVDALTDLPNRASFDAALERLPLGTAGAWGILVLDLDNLKTINDTFGHAAGDALLQAVASRIGSCLGPDRVFRLGGDEFAVILQQPEQLIDIERTATNVLRQLVPAIDCRGHVVMAHGTIGGAILSLEDVSAETVHRYADFALYHAKATNPGGFVLYRAGIGSAIERRIEVIRDVSSALEEDRIDAFYQPVLNLETRSIVGLEALCRLHRPDGEVVSAATFHQATSDVSVASKLTQRMMSIIASDVRVWLDQGLAFQHVGINISSADFHSGTLHHRLKETFGRFNVPLEHVVLEVTESVYLGQRDPVVAREINSLRAHGLRIALDDFGTGFASLTHLLTVPVDIIKIDKSFIDRLAEGDPSMAIVEGLIDIARKLDVGIVAEGIENEVQATLLSNIGCKLGQGYLFSPAVPRQATTGLLQSFGPRMNMTSISNHPHLKMSSGVCAAEAEASAKPNPTRRIQRP